jgi:hypothetical protein
VIKCQREGDTHPDQYDYIVELFQTYFGKRMVTSEDNWWDLQKSTLGECLDNKKNIFVCGGPPLISRQNVDSEWESKNQEAYEGLLKKSQALGIWDRFRQFIDSWENTDSKRDLFQKVTKTMKQVEMRSDNNPQFDKVHITQLILSAQFRAADYILYIFGAGDLRIDKLTQELHKHKELMLFVRDNLDQFKLNVVMMDFVSYQPALTRYLLKSNIDQKLTIKRCWMPEVHGFDLDFTEDVRELVTKGNCLLIPDPIIELCFSKSELEEDCKDEKKNLSGKVIIIVYKYEDNQWIEKKFPLIDNLPILVTYDLEDQKSQEGLALEQIPAKKNQVPPVMAIK